MKPHLPASSEGFADNPRFQHVTSRGVWHLGSRVYFALMACVLVAAATSKGISLNAHPTSANSADPVFAFIRSGIVQWFAIGLETTVALSLMANLGPRFNALTLMGLGLAFLSYRAGLDFAGKATCSCLGDSSVTGLSTEASNRIAWSIIGAAIAGSLAILVGVRSGKLPPDNAPPMFP